MREIRSDDGEEFVSRNFKGFCHEKDIAHNVTVPHEHEMTGRAETHD